MTELTAHDIRRKERQSRDLRRIALSLEMLVQLIAKYTDQEIPEGLNLLPELEDTFVPQSKRVVCQNNLNIGDIQADVQQNMDWLNHSPVWTTREAGDEYCHSPAYIVDLIAAGLLKGYKDTNTNRWMVYEDSLEQFKLAKWGKKLSHYKEQ